MQAHLRAAGIETLIHYPIPIPHQPALATEHPAECPVATRVCSEVFSLPLYPSLADAAVAEVAAALATRSADERTLTRQREPRTTNQLMTHSPRPVLRADCRRAVRDLRSRAAHVGQLRGGAVVSGTVRDRSGHRLPPQAARPHALHDQRVRRRHRHQRRRPARRRGDRTEGRRRTAHRAPRRLARPLGAGAVPADVRRAARAAPEPPAVGRFATASSTPACRATGRSRSSSSFARSPARVQPDLVLPVVFVGNDAEEAVRSQPQARRHRGGDRGRRRLAHDAAAAPRPAQHGPADSPAARRRRDRTAVAVAGAAGAAAPELRGASGAAHRRGPRHRARRRSRTSRGRPRPPARPRRSS